MGITPHIINHNVYDVTMNTITCHKIQHQGLPTEYYFPKQKVTVSNPHQVVDQLQAQWPELWFTLNIKD